MAGLTKREGLALACGMNARGSTEVIIATIGLSMGALSQNLFTMIVAMAVLTTMAMPPTLRWASVSIPMRKEEKQRLEREEMEAKGFVPNLERLLLAVDDSNNATIGNAYRRLDRRRRRHADHGHAYQDRQQNRKGRRRSGEDKTAEELGKTVQEFPQSVERDAKDRRKDRRFPRRDDDREQAPKPERSPKKPKRAMA